MKVKGRPTTTAVTEVNRVLTVGSKESRFVGSELKRTMLIKCVSVELSSV